MKLTCFVKGNVLLCSLLLLSSDLGVVRVVESSSLKVVYAVNAGGYEHTDKYGIHYEADPLHNRIGTASDYGNHLLIIGRVTEQDEVLYRTERYHTATFGYDIPIDGDGSYALVLKFCEVYFNEPNMKVFDVVLNKKHVVVSDLDIFQAVGRGTAHEEYVYFNVLKDKLHYENEISDIRNGVVRLEFIKGIHDNPKINAFVLFKGDVQRIPRLTPMNDDDGFSTDADMAVFHDRISAESVSQTGDKHAPHMHVPPGSARKSQAEPQQLTQDDEDEDLLVTTPQKVRKTSGPRHPNPYSMDDSSVLLPVFIAIGAFIPLLFCLCKL